MPFLFLLLAKKINFFFFNHLMEILLQFEKVVYGILSQRAIREKLRTIVKIRNRFVKTFAIKSRFDKELLKFFFYCCEIPQVQQLYKP